MTTFAIQQLNNVIGWDGDKPVVRPRPVKGLRSAWNRGPWASMDAIEQKGGMEIADAFYALNISQGMRPITVSNPPRELWWNAKMLYRAAVEHFTRLATAYPKLVVQLGNEYDTRESEKKWNFGYMEPECLVQWWRAGLEVLGPERCILGSIQSLSAKGEGLQRMCSALLGVRDLNPQMVGIHLYPGPNTYPIEEISDRIHEVRGALTGIDMPRVRMVATEVGHLSMEPPKQFRAMTTADRGRLMRAVMREIDRTGEVDLVLWFKLDDSNPAHGGTGWDDIKNGAKEWNAVCAAVGKS